MALASRQIFGTQYPLFVVPMPSVRDAYNVRQDIERTRGVIQVKPCKGMQLLGVLSGAWQSMEQRRPNMPSSRQLGWHVAKPLGAARRIHRTTEGIL